MTTGSEDLRTCLRDALELTRLAERVRGRTISQTAAEVLAAAGRALDIELGYVRVQGMPRILEAGWMAGSAAPPAKVTEALEGPDQSTYRLQRFVLPPSVGGVLVLASRRDDFPDPHESILLEVWQHQATQVLEAAVLAVAARRAEQRQDEFLALLGHELRNPLAPIVTALELLELRERHPPRELVIIRRQVEHLTQLVEDLLDVSRLTRGTLELRREFIELSEVIDQSVELAAPLIERHRHNLSVDIPGYCLMHADPRRLAQVFANLLMNAASFTMPGGRIDVEAKVEDDAVRVVVRDTGRGIEPERIRQVFEPFVQVDRAAHALMGGLGLGLTLVKRLVELHDGTVAATSEGRDRGSTFTVVLPVISSAMLPRPPEAAERLLTPEQPLQALVVDDNADAADLLAVSLRRHGHTVDIAYDGPSALASCQAQVPDVGILDLGLPVMSGFELAEEIRRRYGQRVRLVALTGYSDESSRRRCEAVGFDAYMVKPVNFPELLRAMRGPGEPADS